MNEYKCMNCMYGDLSVDDFPCDACYRGSMYELERGARTMSKTYKLKVTEERQSRHDVVIQIDDDTDMDSICDRIEKMLDYTHGDIWSIGYNTGVKVVEVIKDESLDYRYGVTCYEAEGSYD